MSMLSKINVMLLTDAYKVRVRACMIPSSNQKDIIVTINFYKKFKIILFLV